MRLLKRNPNTRSWEQKLRKKRGRKDRGLHEEWVMGDGGGRVMDGEERQGRVLATRRVRYRPGLLGLAQARKSVRTLDWTSTSTLDAEQSAALSGSGRNSSTM